MPLDGIQPSGHGWSSPVCDGGRVGEERDSEFFFVIIIICSYSILLLDPAWRIPAQTLLYRPGE